MFKKYLSLALLIVTALLAACGSEPEPTGPVTPRPTATLNPMFAGSLGGGADRTVDGSDAAPTARPTRVQPTRTPLPTPRPTVTLPPPIPVYTDQLSRGWTTKHSTMEHDLEYTEEAYSGSSAIRLSPKPGGRVALFTVEKGARPVRENQLLGISFRLFSGANGLSIEEFAMSIIGSNDEAYWVKSDRSATNNRNPNPGWIPEDDPISNLYAQDFSETLLGFMGVPRDIPPNTWVEVTNLLDDRIYDPLYGNIVAFYFKTETTVRHDVLVDDIKLIVFEP